MSQGKLVFENDVAKLIFESAEPKLIWDATIEIDQTTGGIFDYTFDFTFE